MHYYKGNPSKLPTFVLFDTSKMGPIEWPLQKHRFFSSWHAFSWAAKLWNKKLSGFCFRDVSRYDDIVILYIWGPREKNLGTKWVNTSRFPLPQILHAVFMQGIILTSQLYGLNLKPNVYKHMYPQIIQNS